MPGSIGATPIEAPIDVEEGLPVEVPVVYFYGHTTPTEHPELYMFLVDRLAHLLDRRARTSPQASKQYTKAYARQEPVVTTMAVIDEVLTACLMSSCTA